MICYRDRTYCPFFHDCKHSHTNGGDCRRPATPEVKADAERVGLWLAVWMEKPDCHELKEGGDADEPEL